MIKTVRGFISTIRDFLTRHFTRVNENLPYVITVVISLIIIVGGINMFIELTDTLSTNTLKAYDDKITEYIISRRTPVLTDYFVFMTEVGTLNGYLAVLGITVLVTAFIFKKWKYVIQVSLVLALSAGSNVVLKRAIERARPSIEHLVTVKTLSYPSGHAMAAMAFYGFIFFLIYAYMKKPILKWFIMFFLALLILSIGISRIYLGVHYPSDIVGGFIAGFLWVVFCVILFDTIELFRRDPKTGEGPEMDMEDELEEIEEEKEEKQAQA